MSLIKCPECSKEISEYAPACPNCGCPKEYFIKKTETNSFGLSSIEQFDTFKFGNYKCGNGKTAPIEWITLCNDGDRILCLSKYGLDNVIFSKGEDIGALYHESTWAKCDLRNWLNTTFYNTAFSEEEKRHITMTNVMPDTEKYNIKGSFFRGQLTGTKGTVIEQESADYLFCLSIKELLDFVPEDLWICEPTEYAIEQFILHVSQQEHETPNQYNIGHASWWLRNTDLTSIAIVKTENPSYFIGSSDSRLTGKVSSVGYSEYISRRGMGFDDMQEYDLSVVRPAMLLKI